MAMERVYEKYRHCMLNHPDLADPETAWKKSASRAIADCYRFGAIALRPEIGGELKLVIPLKNMQDKCTMITLGVGGSVRAEVELKRTMPNCQLHGADPVDEGNRERYEKVGAFYQHAISGGPVADSSLRTKGKYIARKKMLAVPLYYFVTKVVKQSVIDYMNIDCEYAEYDMFDFLLAERAAMEGITFCQINIEVHYAENREQKVQYYRFLRQLLEEGTYVLTYSAGGGHHQIFFHNWRSEECRRRFFEY